MQETSTSPATILQFRQDIEAQFRRHIREALDVALAEELAAALGSARHERTDGRRGYRNAKQSARSLPINGELTGDAALRLLRHIWSGGAPPLR